MLYKAVLFDLDGTLIDSRKDLARAVNLMRESYKLPALEIDVVVGYIGDGMTKLVERSIVGESIELSEAVVVTKKFYGENLVVDTVFYDGVVEFLEWLKEFGVGIALTSNKPIEFCREIVEVMKIDNFFKVIYGGCTDYTLKPAPDMVNLAVADLGVKADECLMIGDNWTDIDAAKAAGSVCGFFTAGMGRMADSLADFNFDSYEELKSLLAGKVGSVG